MKKQKLNEIKKKSECKTKTRNEPKNCETQNITTNGIFLYEKLEFVYTWVEHTKIPRLFIYFFLSFFFLSSFPDVRSIVCPIRIPSCVYINCFLQFHISSPSTFMHRIVHFISYMCRALTIVATKHAGWIIVQSAKKHKCLIVSSSISECRLAVSYSYQAYKYTRSIEQHKWFSDITTCN